MGNHGDMFNDSDMMRSLRSLKSAGHNSEEIIAEAKQQEGGKLQNVLKIFGAFTWIYVFIFSIGLMSDSFQVMGGSFLNEMLENVQDHLNIPYCGLCLGLLLTALCQSSSTSTSIFITLVAADLFTVSQGIYCIMGANIGTSITSTLVAFGNVATPSEFRNSIACAAVPAAFNWLTVLVLLPLEMAFGMLENLTAACTSGLDESASTENDGKFDPIGAITEPIQKYILSVNKKGLGDTNYTGTFVKYCKHFAQECSDFCVPDVNCTNQDNVCMTKPAEFDCEWKGNSPNSTWDIFYGEKCTEFEDHVFVNACWSDEAIGAVCLSISFVLMFVALGGVVKCLKAVLEGSITEMIHKHIDKNLPHPFGWLTEYLYVIAGLVLTLAVQSSSIILAIMTPVVGIGVISIERCYPITVGSKIGTTITGVIAAFANTGSGFRRALQVSMSHTFFNVFGMAIFFVVPVMRHIPIQIAKFCGKEAQKFRWWAVMYTAAMFVIVPVGLFGISVLSVELATVVLAVFVGVCIVTSTVNTARVKKPDILPKKLMSWKWLPIWCRSLAPYDKYICSNTRLCPCLNKHDAETWDEEKQNLKRNSTDSTELKPSTSSAENMLDNNNNSVNK